MIDKAIDINHALEYFFQHKDNSYPGELLLICFRQTLYYNDKSRIPKDLDKKNTLVFASPKTSFLNQKLFSQFFGQEIFCF